MEFPQNSGFFKQSSGILISPRSSGGDPGPGGGVCPGALSDAEISLVRREPDTATALGAETVTLLGTARDIKIGGRWKGGTGLL